MGVLEDIRQWLKETDLGKQLGALPSRMDALEKRVVELENQLKPHPGERCDACGEMALRLKASRVVGPPGQSYTLEKWECENCGIKIEGKG